jgi:hypothetical protein
MGTLTYTLVLLGLLPAIREQQANKREDKAAEAVRLPIEAALDGRIWVEARVNGSEPLLFLLDTASNLTMIDRSRAEALGLAGEGREAWDTPGAEPLRFSRVPRVTLELGGLRTEEHDVAITPLKMWAPRPPGGLIGAPFLNRFVVEIDMDAGSLVLHDPKTFRYRGAGRVVPMTLREELPSVPVRVRTSGGAAEGLFHVDTGASLALLLYRHFVDQHRLFRPDESREMQGRSLGGATREARTRADFTLGRDRYREAIVHYWVVDRGSAATGADAGILGMDVLRRYHTILDYAGKRMILEPGELHGVPWDYEYSGMKVKRDGRSIVVDTVDPKSQAGDAGLQVGDRILASDGRGLAGPDLTAFRRSLRQDGRTHLLRIGRGDQVLDLQLKMLDIR